jgi:hypothetical protein
LACFSIALSLLSQCNYFLKIDPLVGFNAVFLALSILCFIILALI